MCLFKQARPAAGTILITASYVFEIALWVTGFIETFVYWGWTGIIIVLFFFGVGVAPVGFIAALFHADWPTVAFLVMACLATFGARILGLKLIEMQRSPSNLLGRAGGESAVKRKHLSVTTVLAFFWCVGSAAAQEAATFQVDHFAITLQVAPEHPDGYNRDDWPHWNAHVGGGCFTVRDKVLAEESVVPVQTVLGSGGRCRVTAGQWNGPYTGQTFTDAGDVQIDHFVPLKEAYDSGGFAWDRDRRQLYANDLRTRITSWRCRARRTTERATRTRRTICCRSTPTSATTCKRG